MLAVVSITIAAIVIIFVKVGGWTQTPPEKNPHPIIGIIAFILALIQVGELTGELTFPQGLLVRFKL